MTVINLPRRKLSIDEVCEVSHDILQALDKAIELSLILETHYKDNSDDLFEVERISRLALEAFYRAEDFSGVTRFE